MDSELCINNYDFDEFFPISKKDVFVAKISIVQCEKLPFETVEKWLSARECGHYRSFRSEKRTHQYAMGRIAAKNAIMELLGLKYPKEIDISNVEAGYPIVKNAKISITHSNNCAAAIAFLSESSFGIDIEQINATKMQALSYISLENEPIEQKPEQLTIAWCMKESLSKALLCGFREAFETFRIKSLQVADDGNTYQAEYEHYPQYKGIAKVIGSEKNTVIAVTYMDNAK